jgi:AraC family transcriptional regulator
VFTLPFNLVLEYPFAIATYPAGATYGPRHLRNWEFVWLIEGDAQYRRGDETVDAPEGSIVLCRPGAVDFFRWDPARRTRHAYFHFDLTGTFPSDWPAPDTWPYVRCPSQDGDLLRVPFTYLLAAKDGGLPPLQTQLLALSLLTAFVSGHYEPGATNDTVERALPDAVTRALAHLSRRLDAEPDAKITLAEMAAAGCVTPEYLCRLFSAATGRSPMQTVRLARLDRAASLLARTNYGIGEIATLCGFESPFHFSRAFKTAYGRSPRDLRRAVENGANLPNLRILHTTANTLPDRKP